MKKLPRRMCAACRENRLKSELIRIVRSPEGVIALDNTGKMPGRGAYICSSLECLKKARKQRSLERALKCQISDEVWLQLENAMEGQNDGTQ